MMDRVIISVMALPSNITTAIAGLADNLAVTMHTEALTAANVVNANQDDSLALTFRTFVAFVVVAIIVFVFVHHDFSTCFISSLPL